MKVLESKKRTFVTNSLLWFGASVSIAEIMTGGLLAPLGFQKGLLAIIVGHIIGCILLYLAGTIGGNTRLASIKSSRISFGKYGSYGFSVMNVTQLIGWTAVMIISGARALDGITKELLQYSNIHLWSILIGGLIIVWVIVGIKNISKLNVVVVTGLFILTVILGSVVFGSKGTVESTATGGMSFGLAVELSIAMCLSWLPLISDYTSISDNPKTAAIGSTIAYFIGGSLMYVIGLGGALYAGTSDISAILLTAGLGTIALLIVVMSTVTTTFLDVYSAGISFENLTDRVNTKMLMVIISIIGLIIAMFTPIEKYQDFLILIGSVFAPMISILLADYFILKKETIDYNLNITNCILWVIGFVIYREFATVDTILGSSIPVIAIIVVLTVITSKLKEAFITK